MEKRLSFTAWLRRQARQDNAIGDLARDMRRDPEWPRARTLAGFERYLVNRGACGGAIQALRKAWAKWSGEPDRQVFPDLCEKCGTLEYAHMWLSRSTGGIVGFYRCKRCRHTWKCWWGASAWSRWG